MPRPSAPAPDGLTATGATLLSALLTCAGTLIDIVVFRSINWIFTIGFVLAALWVALRIDRRHLWTAVVLPPWMFVLGIVLAQQVLGLSGTGSWLLKEASDTFSVLTLLAPRLLGTDAVVAVIVLSRRVRARRAQAGLSARAAADSSPTPASGELRDSDESAGPADREDHGWAQASDSRHRAEDARPEEREFWRP